jgi:benzodiazapine receptor
MGEDSTRSNLIKLIICLVVCQFAGVIGSFFTTSAVPTWYASLAKPAFTPPDRLFAPVWISLYLFMGVAVFLVWRKDRVHRDVKITLTIFLIHLAFNILWPILFFGFRSPLAGLFGIVILWISIIVTIVCFFRISRISSVLLMPYFLWVSFAVILNAAIWELNR